MSNVNGAFGLRPYRMSASGSNTQGITRFYIQTAATAGTTAKLYEGQPVIPLSTGVIGQAANANGGTVPLLGSFHGVEYVDLTGKPIFSNRWPGTAAVKSGTVAYGFVYANPDQAFLINCSAAIALTDIFANANFATSVTGNDVSGLSLGTLDASTVATTAALNMRIIGFEDTPNNMDVASAGRLAIVTLNNHFFRAQSTDSGGLGI